eukprot:scaffold19998_cov65-Phaeocystis_antarctica.AAC.2
MWQPFVAWQQHAHRSARGPVVSAPPQASESQPLGSHRLRATAAGRRAAWRSAACHRLSSRRTAPSLREGVWRLAACHRLSRRRTAPSGAARLRRLAKAHRRPGTADSLAKAKVAGGRVSEKKRKVRRQGSRRRPTVRCA